MSIYGFVFMVMGDKLAPHWSLIRAIDADSLEEAVELEWPSYNSALRHIWKMPVEGTITFDLRPSPLLSIRARCGEEELEEDVVLRAFFEKRLKEYHKLKPYWVIDVDKLKKIA